MTQVEQVNQLAEAGVNFAGFIFYPKSPRYALRQLHAAQIRKINNINKVGVFVNASAEDVLRTVDECRLHMVQLHGDESPKYCERIADYITVVKAFRLSDNDSVEWTTRPYREVCDQYLFDTLGAGYGGTGKKFDWNVLKGLDIQKPFFLSGGIEKGDEEKIKEFSKDPVAEDLFALDINSRFEISPGVKDINLVKQFLEDLKDDSI